MDIGTDLKTSSGNAIHDVLRFCDGDAPAQQVEAGAKIGGHYSCIGCTAHSSMHDDLAYCFRCDHLTLTDRQQFVLRGKAWKKGGPKPLDKLLVNELREELQGRGIDTDGKLRDELDDIFDEMRSGINGLPALLQPNPENMPSYLSLHEISPLEPLHVLKGHISNIVAELQKTLTGETKVHVDDIIKAALSKETLRAATRT